MIQRKTMSQCISSDYCRGYNDAINDVQTQLQDFREWLQWQIKYNQEEANEFVNMGCPDFEQVRYENKADAFEECLNELNKMED